MNKKATCLAVAAALMSLQANAKIIKGKVEGETGRAISNVELGVRGSDITTTTDNQGRFELDLEPGVYTIDVKGGTKAHFHQTITVTDGDQGPFTLSLEEHAEHRLVVNAIPLDHTKLDMATPAIIVAGEELVLKRSDTLGEILQYEPGVSVSSFGPAVSRPVIRGLGAGRVKITTNQMIVQDASNTSADHDVSIEPLLAEQIEVIKGPATLLYGSGAVGGVVNVTDRKISNDNIEGLTGGVETRLGDSGTGEQTLVFSLDGGTENWNWHVDGYSKETDNIEIPVEAESEALRLSEGEEGGPGEAGEFENSASDTSGGSFGTTFLGDWGHFGVAVSSVDKLYGVPGHHHHEEEEGEDHDEEEHEEEEEENVSIDMKQTRYDLQAQFDSPFEAIDTWFIGYSVTDYEHVELEGDEIGTMFDNEAWELKSYMVHNGSSGWRGVFGLQVTEREFSAIGEEAFVPPSDTYNTALFIIEEKEIGDHKLEVGLRFESQTIQVDGQLDVDQSGLSFSVGDVYTLSEHNKLAINYSRVSRFASVEELFSSGEHVATASFDQGNPELDKEVSNNIDLSYRFETEAVSGEINLFWNQFDNHIYGAVVDETDPCLPAEAAEAAEEELTLICYRQQDAEFTGVELDVTVPLTSDGATHQFALGFIADYISAEFDDGTNVPRIPPMKTGVILNYDFNELSADLSYISYADQDDTAENELATDGFDMVNIDVAYRLPFNGDELFLFFKGQNLLDEEARDHASYLKDLAPRAGRNFVVGARYTF